MKALAKKISFWILMTFIPSTNLYALTSDALLSVHRVTTTEMNAISNPQRGSLVYNTTEKSLYFFTGSAWKRLRALGSETVIQAGDDINISGNGSADAPYVIGGQ